MLKRLKEAPWHIAQEDSETIIRLTWRRRNGVLSFIIFWIFFPVFLLMLFGLLQESSEESIVAVLFTAPLVLLFFYFGRAYWRNYTWIHVRPDTTMVKHGPVWWPGKREISTPQITQIAVRPRRVRAYASAPATGHFTFFDLYAVQDSGKDRLISTMSHFMGRGPAEECAQELEAAVKAAQKG